MEFHDAAIDAVGNAAVAVSPAAIVRPSSRSASTRRPEPMRLPAIGTLALLACGPADAPAPAPRTPPVADAPERPGIYPGQIVAVPDGVTMYAAPDASAAHVRLRFDPPADARADGLVARTMVASAVHGEFVALSTAPDDADFLYGLCTDLVEDLERLETTLYVRRSELLPLVREALAIDHPDGTAVVCGTSPPSRSGSATTPAFGS